MSYIRNLSLFQERKTGGWVFKTFLENFGKNNAGRFAKKTVFSLRASWGLPHFTGTQTNAPFFVSMRSTQYWGYQVWGVFCGPLGRASYLTDFLWTTNSKFLQIMSPLFPTLSFRTDFRFFVLKNPQYCFKYTYNDPEKGHFSQGKRLHKKQLICKDSCTSVNIRSIRLEKRVPSPPPPLRNTSTKFGLKIVLSFGRNCGPNVS